MIQSIYACEPNYIRDYLTKIENASSEDIQKAKALFDNYEKEESSIMEIVGNKAIIKIIGSLSKKGPSPLDIFFGYSGTSYDEIIESIKIAESDVNIKKIVFVMDTPGGEVQGVDNVYNAIKNCKKKTIAENHGWIASAGYWIASACDKIYSLESVNLTGSVGAVIVAVSYKKFYEEHGVKVVDVVSKRAPKKAPDITKKSGIDVLQERVDAMENIFYKRISEGRNVSIDEIKNNFGEGNMLVSENPDGPDAIKAKMIDGVYSFNYENIENYENEDDHDDEMLNASRSDEQINEKTPEPGVEMGEESMNLHEFLNSNPDAKVVFDQAIETARKEGVETGKKEQGVVMSKIATYLGSKEYGSLPTMIKMCSDVLKGEKSASSIDDVVAILDLQAEQKKSQEAASETEDAGATLGEQTDVNNDGIIRNVGDIKSSLYEKNGGEK